MYQGEHLTIKEFARLTGIKRENLRFYDRIGLLSPEMRGENNYRYYSRRQLNAAYLIANLRALGVGIEDIKKYAAEYTPETTLALFAQQECRIQKEIKQLQETSLVMKLHSEMVKEALSHGENAVFIQEKEQESIFLCPPVSSNMSNDDGVIYSYEYADSHGINLSFPQGSMISWEQLKQVDSTIVERYYFKVGIGGNACKPAGNYAVAYGRCNPWKSEALYWRLFDYVQEQHLQICGDAYEEYPFSDITGQDTDMSYLRVEVPVV